MPSREKGCNRKVYLEAMLLLTCSIGPKLRKQSPKENEEEEEEEEEENENDRA